MLDWGKILWYYSCSGSEKGRCDLHTRLKIIQEIDWAITWVQPAAIMASIVLYLSHPSFRTTPNNPNRLVEVTSSQTHSILQPVQTTNRNLQNQPKKCVTPPRHETKKVTICTRSSIYLCSFPPTTVLGKLEKLYAIQTWSTSISPLSISLLGIKTVGRSGCDARKRPMLSLRVHLSNLSYVMDLW